MRQRRSSSKLLIYLSLILSSLGLFIYRSIQSSKIYEVTESPQNIQLTITPNPLVIKPNEESIITINLDTNSHPVQSGLIELNYDPKIISITQIIKGDFFSNRVIPSSISDGIAMVNYSIPSEMASGKTGLGTIVSFKLKGLSEGETAITFSDNTDIIPPENIVNSENISVITHPALVKISSQEIITSSPSPSPISSPSATPEPSPVTSPPSSISPIPSPSPSTTPQPPRSIKPKPTYTPTPLPSPTRLYIPLTNTPFDQSVTSSPTNQELNLDTDPEFAQKNSSVDVDVAVLNLSLGERIRRFFISLFD